MSDALYDTVVAVSVIDGGINVSDQCTVSMDVCVPCQHILGNVSPDAYTEPQCKRQLTCRWDKGDIFQIMNRHDMC